MNKFNTHPVSTLNGLAMSVGMERSWLPVRYNTLSFGSKPTVNTSSLDKLLYDKSKTCRQKYG